MNANEIVEFVKTLRWLARATKFKLAAESLSSAADLIESLQAQLSESQRRVKDARNELCLKCDRYREAHKGACDRCKWKES